jgi:multiple antibiotic resistance protein
MSTHLQSPVPLFYSFIRNDFRIPVYRDEEASSASIVPLALLIAGAGTMTTSLKSQFHTVNIIIAIILNILLVCCAKSHLLKSKECSGRRSRRSSQDFGVVLVIAVKLFAANVKGLFVLIFFYKFTPNVCKYII